MLELVFAATAATLMWAPDASDIAVQNHSQPFPTDWVIESMSDCQLMAQAHNEYTRLQGLPFHFYCSVNQTGS